MLIAGTCTEDCAESDQAGAAAEQERLQIPAHRIVLAAASSYFHAMFTNEMQEARQSHVYMQVVDAGALAELIDYMYTGQVNITEHNVQVSSICPFP